MTTITTTVVPATRFLILNLYEPIRNLVPITPERPVHILGKLPPRVVG